MHFHLDLAGIAWAVLNVCLLCISGLFLLFALMDCYFSSAHRNISFTSEKSFGLVQGGLLMVFFSGFGWMLAAIFDLSHSIRSFLDMISIPYIIIVIIAGIILSVKGWKKRAGENSKK